MTQTLKFTTDGYFTVPSGAYAGKIRGMGGGGGGGGGGGTPSGGRACYGGGGGGASIWNEISFIPDPTKTYHVRIGAGGIGGIGGNKSVPTDGATGGYGGDSIVDDGTNTIALFVGASGGSGSGANGGHISYGGMPYTIKGSSTINVLDVTQSNITGSGGAGGNAASIGVNGNPNYISIGGSSIYSPWLSGTSYDLGGDISGGSGGGGAAGVKGNGGDGGTGATQPDGADAENGTPALDNTGAGGGGGGGGDDISSGGPGGSGGDGGSGYVEVSIELGATISDPTQISNLAAWYKTDSLNTYKEPNQISGLSCWLRADSISKNIVSDPTEISGLVSWYRADRFITTDAGIASLPWVIDNTDTWVSGQPDPDSGSNAYFFKQSTATGLHTFYQYPSTYDAVSGYTDFEIYVKTSGYQWIQIDCTYFNSANIWVDTLHGTIGTVSQGVYGTATASISSAGDGWFKVKITGTVTTPVAYTSAYVRIYLSSGNGTPASSFTGDGTNGVIFYKPTLSYANGQRVSAWADNSGDSTHDALQSTNSQKPTLHATDSAYNNQATISFTRSLSQYLKSSAWSSTLPQPYTIICVGNFDGSATTNQYLIDGLASNEGLLSNDLGTNQIMAFAGGAVTYGSATATNQIIAAIFNSANSSLYASSNIVSANGNVGNTTRTGITFGSDGGLVGTTYLNGKVAEVAIYNRALAQAEIQSLEIYASKRYGAPLYIGKWDDQSETGDANKNLAQTSQSNQPTINISDSLYNGQTTLSFASASSQSITSTAWATGLSQPFTIIVIGNDDGSTTDQVYFDNQHGSGVEDLIWNQGGYYYLGGGSSGIRTTNSPVILAGTQDGVNSKLYISTTNGIVIGNTGEILTGVTLGASVSPGTFLNGKIAEAMVYNRALTQSEIQSLSVYASQRYGITMSVGQLNDLSGTGDANKILYQNSYSQRPKLTWADSAYNNQPSLSIPTGSYLLSGTWATQILGDQTMFLVGNDDGSGGERVWIDNEAGPTECLWYYTGSGTYSGNSNGASILWTQAALSSPQIICVKFASASQIYSNAHTAKVTSGSINSKRTGILLGDYVGATGGTYLGINGKIAEVIIYSRALTTDEIDKIYGYLGNKYKVAIKA